MTDAKKKNIIIIAIATAGICFMLLTVFTTRRELRQTRDQLELAGEQLSSATTANQQLREQLNSARGTLDALGATTERNTGTIKECLQLIRDIRTQVKALEDCLYDYSTCGDNNNILSN